MTSLVRAHFPLVLSAGVLLGSIAWTIRAILGVTNKDWLYPIDDAYIHLSLARTLVEHGVWGIDAAHPSTATSSPGWVVLLAAARILPGFAEVAPALLSIAGSLATCFYADRVLRAAGRPPGLRALALAAVVLLTPLSVLTVLGMEHTLFIAVVLAWVAAVECAPAEGPRGRFRDAALAAAVVWLRPEGALVLLAWALTRFQNTRVRWSVAAGVAAGAAMAVLQWVVGGSPFSIATLVKTALVREPGTSVVAEVLRLTWLRVYSEPWVLVLWLLIVVLVAGTRDQPRDARVHWPIALVLLLPLHVVCSDVGSGFGRYEGYLVVLSIVGAAVMTPALASWAAVPGLACASLALWPLVARPGILQDAMLRDTRTLHGIHFQLARFVKEHAGRQPIVADDIGLLAYYGEVPIVDVVGQATPAVAHARRAGIYNVRTLEAEAAAAGATMAIVSKGWFEEPFGIPARWVHVADVSVVDSADHYTLTVWAISPEEAGRLSAALARFAATLPRHTQVLLRED